MAKIGLGTVLMLAGAIFVNSRTTNGADSKPGGGTPIADPAPVLAAAEKDAPAVPRAAVNITQKDRDALTAGNNAFAFDFYAQLRATPGNLLFSPYSISSALGMTYAGARGETAAQMQKVLHFTLGQEKVHSAFGAQITELNALEKEGKPRQYELAIANRLWGQTGQYFVPAFLDLNRNAYGANLEQLDFVGNAEGSRNVINKWVEGKTKDKIKELIPSGAINGNTRLVLTNAVYFKGKWAKQFDTAKTKPGPFEQSNGQKSQVSFMKQTSNFKYSEQNGVQALQMPYTGSDLAMLVLLPGEKQKLEELEKTLDAKAVAGFVSMMRETEVEVALPKFKLTWGAKELTPHFEKLGMILPFKPGADFSGMTGKNDLLISRILHKAFMDVNEEGTEAAAATAVIMEKGMLRERETFVANRPFLCLIRDVKSGAILFICRVANP